MRRSESEQAKVHKHHRKPAPAETTYGRLSIVYLPIAELSST